MAKGKKDYEVFTCNKCGGQYRTDRNYYQSKDNAMCSQNIIPVCRSCIQDIYEELKTKVGEREALRYILRKCDVPFISHLIDKAVKAPNPVGFMFKEYNSFNRYSDMNYDDSDVFKEVKEYTTNEDGLAIELGDFDNDDKTKWSGYGLTLEQMLYCKKMFKEMVDKYELNSINDLLSAEQYAATAVKMQEAFKKGSAADIERYRKTISSIESDLAIQSKQLKNDTEKDTWGLFIRHIENDEPIEDCKPKKEFEDVDGIEKLIKKYIIGYLPAMLGKQKPKDVLGDDFDILEKE